MTPTPETVREALVAAWPDIQRAAAYFVRFRPTPRFDAGDVAQEAACLAMRYPSLHPSLPARTTRSWAYLLVRRAYFNLLIPALAECRDSRRTVGLGGDVPGREADPSAPVEKADTKAAVHRAVSKLPPGQRAAVVAWCGLDGGLTRGRTRVERNIQCVTARDGMRCLRNLLIQFDPRAEVLPLAVA